jgi:hypothetical protein
MKKNSFIFIALVSVWLVSCSGNDQKATTKFEVRLTDSPGDYQEVNIDIQDVQVNSGTSESGWQSLNVRKGIYNLLNLTNGLDTLLGSALLPVGHLSQVRLVLGAHNTLKINDNIVGLTTPSAQQSGLKLLVNAELQVGITYLLLVDFDAAKSIVSTGNNTFNLKPVIRAVPQAITGAIKGLVMPVQSTPAIYVIMGADTVATSYADSTSGKFLLQGLNAGTYSVSFAPKTGYLPSTTNNVNVSVGSITDLGTVQILQ